MILPGMRMISHSGWEQNIEKVLLKHLSSTQCLPNANPMPSNNSAQDVRQTYLIDALLEKVKQTNFHCHILFLIVNNTPTSTMFPQKYDLPENTTYLKTSPSLISSPAPKISPSPKISLVKPTLTIWLYKVGHA